MFIGNKKLNLINLIIVLMALFLIPHFAFALDAGLNYAAAIGLGANDPRVIIASLIRIALGFLGILAVVIIMYGGWIWMTSGGNEEKITKAKRILVNAVIGLAIILSSFLIVSFIINKLLQATGSSGEGTSGPNQAAGGIGALGNGVIKSVYPEPNQKDVPRNTAIIVTFREGMKPETICEQLTNGNCASGSKIKKGNIRIFKTSQGDSCGTNMANCDNSNITDVVVSTTDNKTFSFTPANYLGSPSEYIWYSVYLTRDLKKADGEDAFKLSEDGFRWQFEVSNKLDLTPPQVLSAGVFPAPDNQQDSVGITIAGAQASGTITVANQPNTRQDASITSVSQVGDATPQATAEADKNCLESGNFKVTILADGKTATLNKGSVLSGSAAANGNSVNFPGYFKLTLTSGNFSAGNQWDVIISAMVSADTLTIGNIIYTFVNSGASGNQINKGANKSATASNIASVLGSYENITASANNDAVTIKAREANADGNNIVFLASAGNRLALNPVSGHLEGGKNMEEKTTINGRADKPRNAIIQVNFNEAVNPLTVSGPSQQVANYIRIVNLSDSSNNNVLSGNFIISNGYRTVEFISSIECGLNSCGEKMYCLPPNSNLKVELKAASLADCGSDNCASRSPYNTCNSSICKDTTDPNNTLNYPLSSSAMDGIMDLAMNSLDGNRNRNAEGPTSFYNENSPDANAGDSFQWSFWISARIDLTAPVITATNAANSASNINLTAPITINFSKVMMSGSLSTGEITVNNGTEDIRHKLINLWSMSNRPAGYWITKENIDDRPSGNLDGDPDWTKVFLNHSDFSDNTSYRAQAGSGIKDIYQNCFKPCEGPACSSYDLENGKQSCCSGSNTNATGFDTNKCSGSQ
jgi:hypothetical protein